MAITREIVFYELTENDTLPEIMCDDARKALKNLGVEFLGPVSEDPLFQSVKLPSGWKKVRTGLMWSDLVDATGEKIAVIFYDATPFNRRADLRLQ